MIERTETTVPFWPWQVWRHYQRYYQMLLRDLAVKHARERAALTAWEIECWHYLQESQQ